MDSEVISFSQPLSPRLNFETQRLDLHLQEHCAQEKNRSKPSTIQTTGTSADEDNVI